MFKKLLALVGLVCVGLAAWPAWADGTAVQRLGTGVATAVAVSPDGQTLAVGTSQGVWFLAAATLTPLRFWDAGQWVQTVAYSADGRYLRANDRYDDLTSSTPALLVPADLKWLPRDCAPGRQRCLVFNLDNLIIRDQDTRIDTALLKTGVLFDAAWSPDGQTIYAAVQGGVQAWDAATGTLRQSQTDFFTGSLFYGVHWSPDGTRVGSGQSAWDITTGQPAESLACGTAAAPNDCAIPHYYSGSGYGSGYVLAIYATACSWCWREIIPHDIHTDAVAFSLDGKLMVTSGSDNYQYKCPAGSPQSTGAGQCQTPVGSTRIWDLKTFKLLGQVPTQFNELAISADGATVVGQTDHALQAWDWVAARQLWSTPGSFNYGDEMTVSPTGNFVAAKSMGPNQTAIALWSLATGEPVATLTGHTAPDPWPSGRLGDAYGIPWYQKIYISGLAFSPDGRHLAASSLDGTVLVWPVP